MRGLRGHAGICKVLAVSAGFTPVIGVVPVGVVVFACVHVNQDRFVNCPWASPSRPCGSNPDA